MSQHIQQGNYLAMYIVHHDSGISNKEINYQLSCTGTKFKLMQYEYLTKKLTYSKADVQVKVLTMCPRIQLSLIFSELTQPI